MIPTGSAPEAAILALLSPAKKLDFDRPLPTAAHTRPAFVEDTRALLAVARGQSVADLQRLMDLSDDLATLTHGRFQTLDPEPPAEEARPALLAFAGDVYVGLDAASLGEADLAWAQDHLRVLSGLYGLLRPLDLIQPYRLEMGTALPNPRGKDLYAFWKARLAPAVDAAVAGHPDPTVVNLASDEYFSAVDRRALKARVVTPVFQDIKDGKARAVFLFVKRARGRMARWIVDHRVERAEDLKRFDLDGYRFVAEASDTDRWVFRRPQPPPVGR